MGWGGACSSSGIDCKGSQGRVCGGHLLFQPYALAGGQCRVSHPEKGLHRESSPVAIDNNNERLIKVYSRLKWLVRHTPLIVTPH